MDCKSRVVHVNKNIRSVTVSLYTLLSSLCVISIVFVPPLLSSGAIGITFYTVCLCVYLCVSVCAYVHPWCRFHDVFGMH